MLRWASLVLLIVGATAMAAQPPAAPPRKGQVIGIPPPGMIPPELQARPQPPRPPKRPPQVLAGPVKLDRRGDPLPHGAIARFGNARLRHGNEPAALAFTPDGKFLASFSGTDNTLRLWDHTTGREAHRVRTPIVAAGLARNGTVIVADETTCKVWHPALGRFHDLPPDTVPEGTQTLAVHPDGRSFAAGGIGPVVALVDVQTGKRRGELKCPDGQPVTRLTYSPDGRWLAATGGPKSGVWLWDIRLMKRVRTYQSDSDSPEFAFSPDGAKLAIVAEMVRLYSTDAEELECEFNPTGKVLQQARFSSDGKSILGVTPEATVIRVDIVTGEIMDTWEPPEGTFRLPFALAADAALVAATDEHGGIHVWDPKTGKETEVDRLPPLGEPWLAPDGKSAAVLDDRCRIHTWNPSTGEPIKVTELPFDESIVVTWDPRSGRAAAFIDAEEVETHFIDIASGKVVSKVGGAGPLGSRSVAFCPTDPARAAVFAHGNVTVVDVPTGRLIRSLAATESGGNWRGAFSPDGRLVAVTTNPLSVWEVATGRKRFGVEAAAEPQGVVFSRDGRLLAAWDATENVIIFDVRAGTVLRRMQYAGEDGSLTVAAFAPDGRRLATGGENGVVSIWDVATGDVILSLPGHEAEITGLTFSRDGAKLLSASLDGTALIWDMTLPLTPRVAEAVIGADEALRLLGAADAAEAQRGMRYFYQHSADAVKLLGEKVTPSAGASAERLAKLVADLDSDDFRTRQTAAKELEAAGAAAASALRQAAEKSASAEVRKTTADILAKVDAAPTKPDDLRAVRAVEVLESIGAPTARQVLAKWAGGPAGARLTTEAAAALARLNPPDSP